MELEAGGKLKEAIQLIGKSNKLLEDIRNVENRKKSLQDSIVDSALSGASEGTADKEIIGLEKVIESMVEKLDRQVFELGRKMKELRTAYRQKAEEAGIGSIAEAVPE